MPLKTLLPLGGLAVLAAASTAGSAPEAELSAELSFKVYPEWDLLLPAETFTPIGPAIPFPHGGLEGFTVEADGTALRIDRDGGRGVRGAPWRPKERGGDRPDGLPLVRAHLRGAALQRRDLEVRALRRDARVTSRAPASSSSTRTTTAPSTTSARTR